MPGETILIVEDAPESLKFTASILRREGYRVSISSTAEQALSTLRFLRPELVLVDFILPGMNGLQLTSEIKKDMRLQKTLVVALTGCAEPGDEARAREAGCDGYLTKPIEPRVLVGRVRDYLDFGKEAPGAFDTVEASPERAIKGLPEAELAELQESFLKGGRGLSRQLLAGVDGEFDVEKAGRTVHQWVGTAGLLGFDEIGLRARDVETVLRTPPCTSDRLRGPITNLARAFQNAGALPEAGSQSVVRVLQGKRVALIGLNDEAADLMCGALEQVGAKARLFEASQSPYDEAVGICHMVVVYVQPENMISRWLSKDAPGLPAMPTIFFGSPENLLSLSANAHARARGLLINGCTRDEALMRLRLAMTQEAPPAARRAQGADPGELVIASGDTASHPIIAAKMKEFGLRCRLASNGPETILMLRDVRPPAAVVDASQDGFEALAAIRAEDMPVRTMFITSQGHEDEILRGFSLGAEDYLVQPFSPLELVARVKRLLG